MPKTPSAESYAEQYLLDRILSGAYKPFQYLEPERELSMQLSLSRPVIHKAIIRLESKGVVTIVPRKGIRVNDYETSAKLSLLEHLYPLERSRYPALNRAMLQFIISNLEMILQHVQNLSMDNKIKIEKHLSQIELTDGQRVFEWIKTLARYSENPIYAMLFNEFEVGIINVGEAIIAHSGREVASEWFEALIRTLLEDGEEMTLKLAVCQFYEKVASAWLPSTISD